MGNSNSIGLPKLNIAFSALAETIVERSSRGVVCIVIEDSNKSCKDKAEYSLITDVDFESMEEKNYRYLQLAFEGNPTKVVVIKAKEDIKQTLQILSNINVNYLVYPDIPAENLTELVSWFKERRQEKSVKLVTSGVEGDHEAIINYTTEGNESSIGEMTYTAHQYCCRIAGILAGLSLNESITYYVLDDLSSADTPLDAEERIAKGELITIYAGDQFKIARGINTLQTITEEKKEDMKYIKIIDGMDLYHDDIQRVFEDEYLGKVVNDLDNKQLFVAAVNAYHKKIEGNVLSKDYENTAELNLDAQKEYLKQSKVDVSKMTDTEILKANTGTRIFIKSNVLFVNCMEDLDMFSNF